MDKAMKEPRPMDLALIDDPEAALSVEEAGRFLGGIAIETLAKWRRTGEGPKYLRLSKAKVAYRKRDLVSWMKEREFKSTSQETGLPIAPAQRAAMQATGEGEDQGEPVPER